MSDAKTAAEIEDILSSIRRLVSQDRKASAVQRPQILSRLVVEDRLILTPAQRVAAPGAKVTVLKREPNAWPETEARGPVEAPASEGRVAAPPSQSAEPPRKGTEPPPQLAAQPAPRAPKPAPQKVEAPKTEPAGRLHLEPPPQGLTPDALAWESEMGDPAPDLASLDWSSFTFARRPMAETYAARSRAAERLAAERPMPASLRPAPTPEPAADTFHFQPRQAEPVAEPVVAEPVAAVAQEEDSIFSEEVLRELVRDLIREQLQGELGERITRNIRKLVKTEIARAVSVQTLE